MNHFAKLSRPNLRNTTSSQQKKVLILVFIWNAKGDRDSIVHCACILIFKASNLDRSEGLFFACIFCNLFSIHRLHSFIRFLPIVWTCPSINVNWFMDRWIIREQMGSNDRAIEKAISIMIDSTALTRSARTSNKPVGLYVHKKVRNGSRHAANVVCCGRTIPYQLIHVWAALSYL